MEKIIMKFSPSKNKEHLALITKKASSNILILKSDEELVESLKTLPDDTDFNHVDGDFNTILYLASVNNYTKTVEYLLNTRKVCPDIKFTQNLTAAHIAAAKGQTEILSQLLNAGIKLEEKDAYGETPLFRAIGNTPDNKLFETVKILLEKDDKAVNIVNEDGVYPIEVALQRTKPEIIKLLLDHKADVSERCYQSAGNLILHQSKPSSQFGGATVFFLGSAHNVILKECAKLIIDKYNSTHLVEKLTKPQKANM